MPQRYFFAGLLVGLLLATPLAASAQSEEYAVKAAFLYNFSAFVDWPQEAENEAGRKLTLGVLGADPFGAHLDALEGRTIAGRTIRVVRFRNLDAVGDVDLLFVSSSEDARMEQVLSAVSAHGVLTVGDAPRFAERGGVIQFFLENLQVRFEINRCAVQRAGLRINARLLRLARITEETCRTEAL